MTARDFAKTDPTFAQAIGKANETAERWTEGVASLDDVRSAAAAAARKKTLQQCADIIREVYDSPIAV